MSLLVFHRNGAEMVPLHIDEPVVIGRDHPSHVRIQDTRISREHARFVLSHGKVSVEDLGSLNGTVVGGKKIDKGEVGPADEVILGGGIRVSVHVLVPTDGELHGLWSHERFRAALEDELLRARYFQRAVGVLMISTARPSDSHVSRWIARVQRLLRPIDKIALYGPGAVEVLLPETTNEAAHKLAQQIAMSHEKGESPLLLGWATFPGIASLADELIEVVRNAVRGADMDHPVQPTSQDPTRVWRTSSVPPSARDTDEPTVASLPMQRVFKQVERIRRSRMVLLLGETGVGKEVVARALHATSPRAKKPMVSVNCGGISTELVEGTLFGHVRGAFTGAITDKEGLFEAADSGTLFLDEVAELPLSAQASLLRVLDPDRMCITRVGSTKEIRVDVRVIAATHRDLEAMCQKGTFRFDLFQRLNDFVIHIPPLRERIEDIEPLAHRFLQRANQLYDCAIQGFTSPALDLIKSYSWPGNVRQLRSVIDQAAAFAQTDWITEADLPERVRKEGSTPEPPDQLETTQSWPRDPAKLLLLGQEIDFEDAKTHYEKQILLAALNSTHGNQTMAAKRLNMPLRTFTHKMKHLGIKRTIDSR